MNTDKFIQEKIDASFHSMEHLHRATPSPYFYTKLIAKLSNQPQTFWERFSVAIAKPVVAFACICVIVLMNLVAVYSNTSSSSSSANDQTEVAAADEFTQVEPAFYDIENTKP